ncbi:tRNA glutamyl-Q(34) synthetase GluQRS [Pseudoxanthomonas dokdonensis]|uniref:Glutamyl-Q tRNA(Asp) synthetase n=1 Tax=Pseudoxanthomonas dokdonensis TaxID=344882 RepID=A0A0R0CMQ0_9GAMM|nr:tRNA glutamyl-Q(34) synthetase GluQRS [Pseudoxanthomonas dokdonensis]KRG71199.1 glutamyl-Q tRNA(Asp) ligase [Pseudoxanthomonas dokdonensis]
MPTAPTPPPPYRGRFAPSPTGDLHLGSLLAAFASWLLARHAGGQWLIRVEDLDPPREVPGAVERQLRTLQALGLESDLAVVRQSQRHSSYQTVLQQLMARGEAFECHCSRSDLADQGGIHHACLGQRLRDTPAIRLRVPAGTVIGFEDGLQGHFVQDLHAQVGDVVLRRADGLWAYQLAVVVDDHLQGITDVVRGADLLDSTPRQMFLQQRLGWAAPRYLHLPLLLDADGQKLSKSLSSAPIEQQDPLAMLRLAWRCLGQAPAALDAAFSVATTLQRAQAEFDPSRLPGVPSITFAATHNIGDASAV